MTPQRFQYIKPSAFPGIQIGLPLIPITLINNSRSVSVYALIDSGSTVSVLPYDLGLQLGLIWEEQTIPTPLVGSLKDAPAWGVQITGQVTPFASVLLKFAWTQITSDGVPVLLGQMSFFQAFDVWFSGSQQIFEIAPKGTLMKPAK